MDLKTHAMVSSVIFLIVLVFHGLRLFYGWDASIGGWEVPMWLSWIAVFAAGYLAYAGFSAGGMLKK